MAWLCFRLGLALLERARQWSGRLAEAERAALLAEYGKGVIWLS
jgi:hypothetical protein